MGAWSQRLQDKVDNAQSAEEIQELVNSPEFQDNPPPPGSIVNMYDSEQYFLPTLQGHKREEKEEDLVNHPKHYNRHGIECIQAIRAALSDEEFRGACKANVLKYIWRSDAPTLRYKNQNGEDLKKALWYLNKLVQEIDKDENAS